MRKQYLLWTIAVFGIFGTIYGAYLLIYHLNKGNGLLIPALVLLICGSAALVIQNWTKRLIQHRLGLFGGLFLYIF